MTDDLSRSLHRLYWFMGCFAVIGFLWYLRHQGPTWGLAFLLGVLGSFGNLWLFNWLSGAIAPGSASRRPWQAGAFVLRYFLLFSMGYVIVQVLDVNPLPVVLGLFASTAAVLVSGTIEIVQNLFGAGRAR